MRRSPGARHVRLVLALSTLFAIPVAGACGDDGHGVVAPVDAASSSDRDAANCADLENDAPPSPFVYQPGPAPEPTGGSVADGVYSLTRTTQYGTDGGTPFADKKETRRFLADKMDQVYAQTPPALEKHRAATFTTNGERITFQFHCTEVFEGILSYSATSTELSLFYGTRSAALVETFTKR